jgi:hypothetical protein
VDRGGRFVHLGQSKLDNHPERYYWFCPACENEILAGWERYASRFCGCIDKSPTAAVAYDERLLKFAVSISWRTAKAWMERNSGSPFTQMRAACRQWKSYLLQNKHRVEPYSQHLFIVHDRKMQRHNGLGGNVFFKENLVFTQIGPLWILGLLTRKGLGLNDIKVWDKSRLRSEGGTIQPIKEWRVGNTLTRQLCKFLSQFEVAITSRALEVVKKLGDRLS